MARTLGKLLLLAALAAPLVACATNSSAEAGSSTSTSPSASPSPSLPVAVVPTPTPVSAAPEGDRALLESVLGTWGDEGGAFLTFTADGMVVGSDGCNGVGATFAADGDTISLTRMPSTMKACPNVDTWLSGVRFVKVDADQLIILDRSAVEIGTLPRTA